MVLGGSAPVPAAVAHRKARVRNWEPYCRHRRGAAVVSYLRAAAVFIPIKEAERGVVTRFGKFSHLVAVSSNWKLTHLLTTSRR